MKIILAAFICFLTAASVKAQTGQSEPTKEDALNFMNPVAGQYPCCEPLQNEELRHTTTVRLDGCTLTIDAESFYKKYIFLIRMVIDLSSVHFVDADDNNGYQAGIMANHPGAIYNYQLNKKHESDKYIEDRNNRLDSWSPVDRCPFDFGLNYNDGVFKDNNYEERYRKAFVFLVKACGGGTVKTDPNQKF